MEHIDLNLLIQKFHEPESSTRYHPYIENSLKEQNMTLVHNKIHHYQAKETRSSCFCQISALPQVWLKPHAMLLDKFLGAPKLSRKKPCKQVAARKGGGPKSPVFFFKWQKKPWYQISKWIQIEEFLVVNETYPNGRPILSKEGRLTC